VRRVEFYELPKTISGKIRRVELRAREQAAADSGERLTSEWRDSEFPELRTDSAKPVTTSTAE
jgi:acetyl-CoA synthetase